MIGQGNNYIIDYRDPYCATYNGILTSTTLLSNQNARTQNTFSSSVTVSKNISDSIISISTSQGIYFCKLTPSTFKSTSLPRVFGNFYSNDSISFTLIFSSGPNKISFKGKK